MQGLIHVWTRHGNEVLDASRNGPPRVVDYAKRRVTVLDAVGNETQSQHVVNLIDSDALLFQLKMYGVKPLDPRLGETRNPMLTHCFLNNPSDFRKKGLVFFSVLLDEVFEFLIRLRVEIAESQVLQFAADFSHTEPVSQRSIDLEGFA